MAQFEAKLTGTIKAALVGESDSISVAGVTTVATTQENAATQINKILAVADKVCSPLKMTRTIVQQGEDD